jgi:hypothetical protein
VNRFVLADKTRKVYNTDRFLLPVATAYGEWDGKDATGSTVARRFEPSAHDDPYRRTSLLLDLPLQRRSSSRATHLLLTCVRASNLFYGRCVQVWHAAGRGDRLTRCRPFECQERLSRLQR